MRTVTAATTLSGGETDASRGGKTSAGRRAANSCRTRTATIARTATATVSTGAASVTGLSVAGRAPSLLVVKTLQISTFVEGKKK